MYLLILVAKVLFFLDYGRKTFAPIFSSLPSKTYDIRSAPFTDHPLSHSFVDSTVQRFNNSTITGSRQCTNTKKGFLNILRKEGRAKGNLFAGLVFANPGFYRRKRGVFVHAVLFVLAFCGCHFAVAVAFIGFVCGRMIARASAFAFA